MFFHSIFIFLIKKKKEKKKLNCIYLFIFYLFIYLFLKEEKLNFNNIPHYYHLLLKFSLRFIFL